MLISMVAALNKVAFAADSAEELKREVFTEHEIALIEETCDRIIADVEIIRSRVAVRRVKKG
jgi:hypothetical protein